MLIELSSTCNLNCKRCPRKQRPNYKPAFMSFDLYREIIQKLSKSHISRSLYLAGYGESTLHPKLLECLKLAKDAGCYIMLPTNGLLIKDNDNWKQILQYIDALHLSVDSFKKNYLKGSLFIWDVIPFLEKQCVKYMLNVTLGRDNYDEVDDFIRYSKETNTSVLFIYANPMYASDKEVLRDYKYCIRRDEELRLRIRKANANLVGIDTGCKSLRNCRFIKANDIAIDYQGNIYPCSVAFFYPQYKFGHVHEIDNFDRILQSPNYQVLRLGKHPLCNCCKQADKLWDNYADNIFKHSIDYLKRLKNFYEGEDCFVLCTGPSLNKVDFSLLKDKILFGVNTLYNAFDRLPQEPKFYACSDEYTFLHNWKELLKLKMPLFLTDGAMRAYLRNQHIYEDYRYKEPILIKEIGYMWRENKFSTDPIRGFYNGDTVTVDIVLQMCYWMGFKRIYLLGLDHNYMQEQHHFDGTKEDIDVPPLRGDMSRIEASYNICRLVYEHSGREIINLTEGTKCDIFKKQSISEVLK